MPKEVAKQKTCCIGLKNDLIKTSDVNLTKNKPRRRQKRAFSPNAAPQTVSIGDNSHQRLVNSQQPCDQASQIH
jgi:hypothetical protein